MPGRIIQFGTSRFLQAHVDLFVHEARAEGQNVGPISVVKTTSDTIRNDRITALRRPGGFQVRIRGCRDGFVVDEKVQVTSVDEALSAGEDWPRIIDLFANEAEIAVSNVGDRGYDVAGGDLAYDSSARWVPASFPAKLLALLIARYEASAKPLLFLPCELISSNGGTLRDRILSLAGAWHISDAFRGWLQQSVVFADTLVDRIVSEEIYPIGAIAEPYALWAIRNEGFAGPLTHPSIIFADDLEPFERLKLHILNLGHTVLADKWMTERRPADQTVREMLAEPSAGEQLADIYSEEVVPGFAARGMHELAESYVETTVERFRNPFLNHRLRDIAQNQAVKIERRVKSFLAWVHEVQPSVRLPRLSAIAARYH
jgi:tagaturonate reductase